MNYPQRPPKLCQLPIYKTKQIQIKNEVQGLRKKNINNLEALPLVIQTE